MADSSVAITPGSGATIRVLTALGAGSAGQQVITLGDAAGNLLGTTGAPLPVVQADSSAVVSIAATATASGQLTGLSGAASATVQLTGTFVATSQIQVTADGSTWVNITGSNTIVNAATGVYMASGNLTAVGVYQVDIGGFAGVRLITTAYTSGTVAGIVRVSNAGAAFSIEGVPTVTLSANTPVLGAGANLVGAIAVGATIPSASYYVSTTTNAATTAKASAGNLQALLISNTAASTQYVKLFNATAVTLGTTAAIVDIPIAAGATLTPSLGPNGARFTTGIAYAITGAAGATNNTAGAGGVYIAATYV